jgi:hypothetical protein
VRDQAHVRGHCRPRARLDTGPQQARARRMYERAGYVPIENFNGNPVASFFGEKRL